MERERVAFNFKELVKSFFGNGEAYVKDDEIDREVNKIIAEQDSDFIRKQEKAVTTGNKAGGKKNDRINVKAAKKEELAKSGNDRERGEER